MSSIGTVSRLREIGGRRYAFHERDADHGSRSDSTEPGNHIETGVGFFDQPPELACTPRLFGSRTSSRPGDLVIDEHHTVEDVAAWSWRPR